MKKWIIYLIILATLIALTTSIISGTKAAFLIIEDVSHPYKAVSVAEKFTETRYHSEPIKPFPLTTEKLPEDLVWETGIDQPVFSDPNARQGGTYNTYMTTFPQTFRQLGTNSNSAFRGEMDDNDMQIVYRHPETGRYYPGLASAWAIGKDGKTVYYKINPKARWSDGVPVTTDDFVFMLKMMRSKGIISPWYNEYYSKYVIDILKFDDYTYAVKIPYAKPDPIMHTAVTPKPYHFYGNLRTEVKLKSRDAFHFLSDAKRELPQELKLYEEEKIFVETKRKPVKDKISKLETKIAELQESIQHSFLFFFTIEKSDKAALKVKEQIIALKNELESEESKLVKVEEKYKLITTKIKNYEETTGKDKIWTLKTEDLCENWNSKYTWKVQPNTGPYQITKYMHGKWVLLERNAKWWATDEKFFKNRFNPQFRKHYLVADYDIAFEYFRKGILDMYNLHEPRFWYKKSVGIKEIENGYMYRIQFWNDVPRPLRMISVNVMNKENPLVANKDIREGIGYSLNIQKMIDIFLLGDAQQASSIATGYGEYSNTKVKFREFNLDKAAEHFAKAGFDKIGSDGIRVNDKGERLSFKLFFGNKAEEPGILIIKNEAAKAGLEFELVNFDANSIFKQMLNKKHQLAWHGWGAGSREWGPGYWGQFHGANAGKPQNNNFANLNVPVINELIDKFRKSIDLDERYELSKEIQKLVHDQACAFPTFYRSFSRIAVWNWIKLPENCEYPGYENPFHYLDTWWIDEKQKTATFQAMKEGKKLASEKLVEFKKFKIVEN